MKKSGRQMNEREVVVESLELHDTIKLYPEGRAFLITGMDFQHTLNDQRAVELTFSRGGPVVLAARGTVILLTDPKEG